MCALPQEGHWGDLKPQGNISRAGNIRLSTNPFHLSTGSSADNVYCTLHRGNNLNLVSAITNRSVIINGEYLIQGQTAELSDGCTVEFVLATGKVSKNAAAQKFTFVFEPSPQQVSEDDEYRTIHSSKFGSKLSCDEKCLDNLLPPIDFTKISRFPVVHCEVDTVVILDPIADLMNAQPRRPSADCSTSPASSPAMELSTSPDSVTPVHDYEVVTMENLRQLEGAV
eukprot:gene8615-1542_t